MNEPILSFLSLCRKAQQIKMGFDAVEKCLPISRLLIFSSDVSEKTKSRMMKKAQPFNVSAVTIPFKTEDIYVCVGKPAAVLSITDKGLAEAFLKRLDSSSEQNKNRSCNTAHNKEDFSL